MTRRPHARPGSDITAQLETGRLRLRDGHVVDVRPLEPGDREGLAAGVRRLSDQTRYLRFASAKPRLTNRELDFLLDVDHHHHEAIVAIDPTTGRGVAVVRYIQVQGEPHVAEIAATVTDDWQGRGLGTALLAQLAARARDEGYSAFRANVLASNHRTIAMLLAAGFAARPTRGTLREYELALAHLSGATAARRHRAGHVRQSRVRIPTAPRLVSGRASRTSRPARSRDPRGQGQA
jgi:RimJ/RimL family protein N-acetyltransferase